MAYREAAAVFGRLALDLQRQGFDEHPNWRMATAQLYYRTIDNYRGVRNVPAFNIQMIALGTRIRLTMQRFVRQLRALVRRARYRRVERVYSLELARSRRATWRAMARYRYADGSATHRELAIATIIRMWMQRFTGNLRALRRRRRSVNLNDRD